MVPRPLDRYGVEAQGEAGGEQNLTRTQGGVSQKQQGGVSHPPPSICRCRCSAFRPKTGRPEPRQRERDVTGATPPFVPLARHGEGGVSATVSGTVSAPPRLRGGRSRLYVSLQEGSPARTPAGRRAETSGGMFDRLIRAFLVVGGGSVASAWTWPGVFPEADPVAVLIRYHTPNVYRAVVAS